MLTRFAANATRSWSFSCCRRVCAHGGPRLTLRRHYTSEPLIDDAIFYKIIERRLRTLRSSLGTSSYTLKPSSSNEVEAWKGAVNVVNFDVALQNCGDRLLSAPDWVIFYLFSSKIHSPAQAVAAVNVMLQRFAQADRILQPALIILVIRFLAWQQVEAPVPNLIKLFLVLDLMNPPTQFNLLLRNLSHFKPSPVLAKVTTQIIDAMHGRQIKLHARTYRTLLSNSLVTLELAKKLQQTMELQGTKPDRHHLEAYLRVFAHHGAVHASARYLNLIRKHQEETGGIVPHGVDLSFGVPRAITSENSANTRFNTEFLMSLRRHTGSAFQYLRDMVEEEEEDVAPIFLRTMRKESRIGRTMRKDRPRVWKSTTNVTDWTTVLNVAAHDKSISGERLLQLFDDTHAKARFPLTVANFTVLMRGLARKGDYATALEVWERCCASWTRRRQIDTKALTVAMGVIVANGYHLAAFDTLVETTGVLHDKENQPKRLNNTAIGRRRKRALYSKRAKVDVPLVNSLMNAYQKNGRPDLVFKLWDAFFPLFGVHPNGDTLTVVLDAAYSVSRWDRTFRGLLEQLGLYNLFRSTHRDPFIIEEKSRRQIAQHIQWLIRKGAPSSLAVAKTVRGKDDRRDHEEVVRETKKMMRKTLWNGELAAPKAVKLFQDILLGNYPQLRHIEPPARAVWPDEASSASPMRDALNTISSRLRGRTSQQESSSQDPKPKPLLFGPSIFPSLQSPSTSSSTSSPPSSLADAFPLPSSPHPQITPTALTFSSYISLLSSLNRASQIPLTLAWMRYLHIRPLKRSLAIAIALWSEAAMRGPLIDAMDARSGRESEFVKFRRWLGEWLGSGSGGGMPSEMAVSWAFRKLREERER